MLKNRNWFPVNTEIYTTQGWIKITALESKSYELVGYIDGELVQTDLKEFNKYSFAGNLKKYKTTDLFIEGHYTEDKIIRYNYELELPKPRNSHYNGYLYSIVTTCNNYIMRNFKKRYNFNDYNIVQCKIESVR